MQRRTFFQAIAAAAAATATGILPRAAMTRPPQRGGLVRPPMHFRKPAEIELRNYAKTFTIKAGDLDSDRFRQLLERDRERIIRTINDNLHRTYQEHTT